MARQSRRTDLSPGRLRELALAGADTVLRQLRAEIVAIERAFPELAPPRNRKELRRSIAKAQKQTRQMSAAARKALSRRMKKYWAERRKAKAAAK
jgi:hypothetical protein